MKRILVVLMIFAFVVPSALASGPPPQDGTPPPQGDVPPIGPKEPGDAFAVDLANLPVPKEWADTGFAMDLSSEKRDKGHEWVRSLTDEQRARIGQLLADNPTPRPDNVGDPAQARQSADELRRGVEALEASRAEVKLWQNAISAELAGILTPEQYELYQDSLLPAPDGQMLGAEPKSQDDCYYAYYYTYYGMEYAFYFYLYAYWTSVTVADPYAPLTFELAYNTYLYNYYAYMYTIYAFAYYYDATYSWYAYYFATHAAGFANFGHNMAYILYTWEPGSTLAYDSYLYGYYAYNYTAVAESYALGCYQEPQAADKYAVVVGIADFLYGTDLNYTDDDAYDFRDTLLNYGGFSSDNINLMIDSQATKASIQDAITNWLDSREDADSLVVIFYSAHGTNGTDVTPIDEADGLDEYLIAYDTSSLSTAIRDEEFDGWLDNLESNNVVVIIDTCFSGGMIGSSAAGDGQTGRYYPMPGQEAQATSVLPGDGFPRDVNQSGRIVMTASEEDDESWETGTLQNGVFTYFLVEGLESSSADTDSNSWVSAEEAHTYLYPLVESYTSTWDPVQHPQISDNISGQVDLTQPASSASVDQRRGYLPVAVKEGESSGQEQPGDRGVLPFDKNIDLSSLPVPEELASTGFAMSLDRQKAQMSSDLVRSLTAEQKDQIRALFESSRSAALDRAADLAQAAQSSKEPGQDPETLKASLAEVKRWQDAMSAGLSEILTAEQYELYQDSLLPAPEGQMLGAQPKSEDDCYDAYVYNYYAEVYGYYYYLYAYYTYAYGCGDPYAYKNYLFGYYSYIYSYYAKLYSYYAYVYCYDAMYSWYAYYFTRHAEGFSYWGYQFASMTYTWCPVTDAYYAYLYGYYTYYYASLADPYALYCYTDEFGCGTIPNGDFESGPTSWTEYSALGWPLILSSSELPVTPHGGSWAAWLGGDNNETATIYQYVTVPSGSPYLSYWYWIDSADLCYYDYGYVTINGSHVKTYDLCSSTDTGGWVNGTVSMSSYASQTVLLQFIVTTDSSIVSSMLLDDIAWASTASAETTPATEFTRPAIPFQRPGVSEPSDPGDKPQPDTSSPEAEYSLTADRDTVLAGECVTLKWHAENVREAYLDGEGLVGADGEKVDCPCHSKDYVLHVLLADGSTRDVIRTVTVKGECGAPLPQVPDEPFVRPRQ